MPSFCSPHTLSFKSMYFLLLLIFCCFGLAYWGSILLYSHYPPELTMYVVQASLQLTVLLPIYLIRTRIVSIHHPAGLLISLLTHKLFCFPIFETLFCSPLLLASDFVQLRSERKFEFFPMYWNWLYCSDHCYLFAVFIIKENYLCLCWVMSCECQISFN